MSEETIEYGGKMLFELAKELNRRLTKLRNTQRNQDRNYKEWLDEFGLFESLCMTRKRQITKKWIPFHRRITKGKQTKSDCAILAARGLECHMGHMWFSHNLYEAYCLAETISLAYVEAQQFELCITPLTDQNFAPIVALLPQPIAEELALYLPAYTRDYLY